jgi:act minimal PKS chain-length factor (CLF/KS beta)
MTEAAVITGLGVVAPTGVGAADYWQATLAGISGIGPVERFDAATYPTSLAGEVRGLDTAAAVPGRLVPQTDRWTQLALVAADLAMADADVDTATLEDYRGAVVTASSSGGTEFGQREMTRLWTQGPRHVGAYQSIAWFYAATTGQLSIRHGLRGPCGVLATEQAGGLDAIGHARRMLRDDVDLVLTGGTDAALCPYALVAQMTSGRLSTSTDASRAYAPYGRDAAGYVPGEGGAIVVLERLGALRRRGGPPPYAAVTGYAATFDPAPDSPRPPRLGAAVLGALGDAGTTPEEIDVVFGDASGVPELDLAEARMLRDVFGPEMPVTAPKAATGRLYAGGSSLDVACAALSLRHGIVPPTVGVDVLADGCDLDLVRGEPRELPLRRALVLARGFGGFNAALVLERVSPADWRRP